MIKNKIQAKLAKAFDSKLSDTVFDFTCTKTVNSGAFDFTTQTYATTTAVAYTGRGVMKLRYDENLVKPQDYQANDCKAIVLQNEISAIPQIDDELTTDNGTFRIINIKEDPASATYTLQLRQV